MEKCNTCCVNERRYALKKKIANALGGECAKCGYNKCLGALTVHHLDSSIKQFNISGAHSRSWKSIEQEISNCILLCANCHNEEHHDCSKYGCLEHSLGAVSKRVKENVL
jgi:hypothetical protein